MRPRRVDPDRPTDDEYERQASAALSALGGVEVAQGSYSRKEFSRLGRTSTLDWAALADRVKDDCAKNRADAILFAYPTGAPSDLSQGRGRRHCGAPRPGRSN